jgi:hypothetical protein
MNKSITARLKKAKIKITAKVTKTEPKADTKGEK